MSLIVPLGVRTPMLDRADPRFAAMVAGPIKEPEDIAGSVVDAIRKETFLVTPTDRRDVDAAQD